jgi:hypothetical protein
MAKGFIQILLAIGLASMFGCGYYSLSGGLPDHIATVGVEPFENHTVESGVSNQLLRSLGDRLVNRPQFRYASSRLADAVVRGEIIDIVEEPLSYTGDQATQYRIAILVEANLFDRSRRRTLWTNNQLRGFASYDATSGVSARETALTESVDSIAEQIVDGMASGW